MPLPPADESVEEREQNAEPKLHFSYVECLMFTFHQMGNKAPQFLTGDSNNERLKDFRVRSVSAGRWWRYLED